MTIEEQPVSRRNLALKGGLWSAAGQILPAVGTAVLSVAAGRYLGSGPLGRQSLIAYVNASSAAVIVLGLRTALLQIGGRLQGQQDRRRLEALVRWALPAHALAGVAVLGVLMLSAVLDGRDFTAWLVIGVVAVFDALANGLSVRFILREGWVRVGRMRLVSQLVGPPLGLAFLFLGFGIAGIFFGDGLAAVGLLVVMAVRYRSLPPEDDTEVVGRTPLRPPVAVARGYWLFAVSATITQIVSKRVEFVVLAVFSSDVAIGMYSVAFMVVNLISMIPLGVATAAMPMIAAAEGRGESDVAAHHLKLALRIGTVLSIPLVALVAAVGPPSVRLVYGSAYGTAARLVPLASAGLLVAVIIGVASQYWSGQGRLRIVLGTGAVAAVADLAVALTLIPSISTTGAVIANLVGQVVLAGGLLLATVRVIGPLAWRADRVLRAGVVGAGGAAAVVMVQVLADVSAPGGPEVTSAVTVVFGGGLGLAAIVWLARLVKVLAPDEADWLQPIVPRRLRPLLDAVTSTAGPAGPADDRRPPRSTFGMRENDDVGPGAHRARRG